MKFCLTVWNTFWESNTKVMKILEMKTKMRKEKEMKMSNKKSQNRRNQNQKEKTTRLQEERKPLVKSHNAKINDVVKLFIYLLNIRGSKIYILINSQKHFSVKNWK